jgi:hypothetical protein
VQRSWQSEGWASRHLIGRGRAVVVVARRRALFPLPVTTKHRLGLGESEQILVGDETLCGLKQDEVSDRVEWGAAHADTVQTISSRMEGDT